MGCLRKSLNLFNSIPLEMIWTHNKDTQFHLFSVLFAKNVLYLYFKVRLGCFETSMRLRGCGVVNGMIAHIYYGCVTHFHCSLYAARARTSSTTAVQRNNVPHTRKQMNAICLNSSKSEKIAKLGQPAIELMSL